MDSSDLEPAPAPRASTRIVSPRRRAAVILALVLVAVGGWWLRPSGEPRIDGYPISAWLEALAGRPAKGMEPADLVGVGANLEKLGPRAYPALTKALLEPRPVRQLLLQMWLRLPEKLRRHVRPPPSRDVLREVALGVCRKWTPEHRAEFARHVALVAVARFPRVDPRERATLVSEVLRELHPPIDAILPAFRAELRAAVPEVEEMILFTLVDYGREALPAVPELTAVLERTNVQARIFATQLLGRMGTEARSAAPALERLLGTGFDDGLLAQALWAVDRRTNIALSCLTNRVEDRTGNSAYTLGTMGEAARPALPALVAGLASPVGNVRMNSARAVTLIDPAQFPRALAAVVQALTNGMNALPQETDRHGAAWYAAFVLREWGTNAEPARAALELGARSRSEDIASECRQALAALKPTAGPVRDSSAAGTTPDRRP